MDFTVTTAANGAVAWVADEPVTFRPGRFITATARDPEGNTSEFSEAIEIKGGIPNPNEILYALLGLVPVRVDHDVNDDGATDISDHVLLNFGPG